ncbi:DNA repair protein RecN [Propionivibrio dicarboxylicus]|uniref:DNA repair protein RecN n=1 Tax=Propionivibrio dicarboxylicus TaxID=83767 RepID=A0A1G7XLC0_9RHOO|nr:DNA repair protein RecN [Propionivibrio dicarboxylicus]SDG84967.1 DNA repair protein RecN (Recombination protein N) [Propionivibrio dicarboxylicus]
MLLRLTIRDFVLVDRLELDFQRGFGALTGETGAGKSILVDALAFVLGERADTGWIRAGAERAEVSAEFEVADSSAVIAWLRELDLECDDGVLILRRVVDTNGRSRAYLCGSPVTVQQLREVAEALVDIHGQHAHQSLLRREVQRSLLDEHAGLMPLAEEVATAWRQWREAQSQLDAASAGADAIIQEREQLEWQCRELSALGVSADEWDGLNVEHKRLAHAASLADGARFALGILSEEEGACEGQIDAVVRRLDDLLAYDAGLGEIAAQVASAQTELAEAVSALRRYADRMDLDPQRLGEVERRIEAVLSCARKFRVAPEALPALLDRWQARLSALGEAADVELLAARVASAHKQYDAVATRLSKSRLKAAKELGDAVSRVMQQLALGGGRFEVGLVPVEGGASSGLEQVEFRIAGLAGSEARPLAKVASGGELSRISLAIQVVTAKAASVPTLVFDEVDVGIGGGVAEVVGRLLRELGQERQVLCVTHLPQVAARANWQWQVAKSAQDGVIRSRVETLEASARVEEIARMLGGVEITEITRRHAREMLGGGE